MVKICRSLTLVALLISIAVNLCACGRDASAALVGAWEKSAEVYTFAEGEEYPQMSDMTIVVSFYKDGTGLWATSVDEDHAPALRTFTYAAEENCVTMLFEDGKTECYEFSVLDGVLSLNSNRLQLSLMARI